MLLVLLLNLVLSLTPALNISYSNNGESNQYFEKPSDIPYEKETSHQISLENTSENESQTRGIATPKTEIDTNKKVALIIGNSEYNVSSNIPPLENPLNDAKGMADALQGLGFEVIMKLDLSKDATIEALDEFHNGIANNAAVALFYYSGHGLQYEGDNYMLPVTSIIDKNENIKRYGVNFSELVKRLEDADSQTNILIFDACRSLPNFQKTRGVSINDNMGLAQISITSASYIVYSTSPGEVALDGLGSNSPFTEELLLWIKEPGLTIEQVFKRVRRDVMRKTDNAQRPWSLSSLIEEFYFIPPDNSNQLVVETDNFDQAYAYFNIGLEQAENNNYDEAIKTFSKVTEISPDYAEAFKEIGTLYIKKKEYNKSLDNLEKAIELKPDFAAAYNNRGIVYSILHEYGTALDNFDKALEIEKGFLKSYNNKARLFQIQGENEKALDVYAKALEINPNYAPVYYNRGLLYFTKKQYRKAVDDYTKAIENDVNYAGAYHNRGIARYYLGMNEEALEDYNNAIFLDSSKFKYYRDRAHLYEDMGFKDKAKLDRKNAAKLSEKK